jgi:Na+-driven multidrug efflux pump
MDILRIILLVLHFVGLSMLLGGVLVQAKAVARGRGTVVRAMIDGALTQLITGLLLVATIEMGDLGEVNNVKIAVKLVIAIVITVLVFLYRKKDPAPSWALWAIGALTLANVVIAVAWR